jgi:hypothetical protein
MLHPDARISTTHETEDPVLPRGTLDRFLLRTEQTGWAVLYELMAGEIAEISTFLYQTPVQVG